MELTLHLSKREASTASRTALLLITGRVPGVAQSKSETVVLGGAKVPAAPCSELDLHITREKMQSEEKMHAHRENNFDDVNS
jgi:hypothetical protein